MTDSGNTSPDALAYLAGFGNEFESEAAPGALPRGQNSPQRCPLGLYAEQLSGTAFTAPRASNRRSWLYRIRPSVTRLPRLAPVDVPRWRSAPEPNSAMLDLAPQRWDPAPLPDADTGLVNGMLTITTAGDVHAQAGMASHVLRLGCARPNDFLCNADGEMLIVPEHGRLRLRTELGTLDVAPGEFALAPRGIVFAAVPLDGAARAYVCENYGALLELPELGPIGANGSASPRDFLTPVAAFEEEVTGCTLTYKWGGRFYAGALDHSPLDVVAWHGSHVPYKYDLQRFAPMGSLLTDHPDPSIFTVLTSASGLPGVANIDFVAFPPRWLVAENTFRPPWYHRNVMSEFMGLVHGVYDAKPEGFVPGGMSLHNAQLPHGPDANAYAAASSAELKPKKLSGTLAFMFETRLAQHISTWAAESPTRQADYVRCWDGIEAQFGR